MEESVHFFNCGTCGELLDKRDIGTVLNHGWLNPETGKYECVPSADISFEIKTVHRKGDSIEYTKDKQPIHLN